MSFIKYDKVFNEKLKAQAKQFLLVCQNEFWKCRCCIDELFNMKVLTEKGRYNLETCLMCLDCVKSFERVIKTNYFKCYKGKIFPIYY
jgi:hypothetical protein